MRVVAGPTDAVVAGRAAASGSSVDDITRGDFAGSAAKIADKIGALREQGFTMLHVQLLDIHDLDHAEFIVTDVNPHAR